MALGADYQTGHSENSAQWGNPQPGFIRKHVHVHTNCYVLCECEHGFVIKVLLIGRIFHDRSMMFQRNTKYHTEKRKLFFPNHNLFLIISF